MSPEQILTSLSLGLLSTTSPCILPLYPGFLAYLSGRQEAILSRLGRYSLGFFVLAGVMTMMLVLGLFIALLSVSVGAALSVIIPLADGIIILLGITLLMDYNPFKRLPQVQMPLLKNPYINAYVYGLLYGPIALPCSGPFLVGLFTYSLTAAEAFSKLFVFWWFGVGFGVPLLVLSLLSGAVQRSIVRLFAAHSLWINRIGGILLIGIGIYDFVNNWNLVKTYLQIWFY
jgi:cytochrome c-type biogenesis protein